MEHSFNIEHAKKYGIEEAIFIKSMSFWIVKNRANNKHFIDNRTWTYNSHKAFKEIFPYLNEHKIKRVVESLVSQGVLVKGNYNKSGYDRTCWYAFVNEESIIGNAPIHLAKMINGNDEIVSPIPDTNTISNTYTNVYNTKDAFVSRVNEFKDKLGNEYQGFIEYWTEANLKGKMRFQDQKFFDVSRRIAYWLKNAKNYNTVPTNRITTQIKLK